jgi:hypothetical protein
LVCAAKPFPASASFVVTVSVRGQTLPCACPARGFQQWLRLVCVAKPFPARALRVATSNGYG